MIPVAPVTTGAQLCWVKDASALCLGCVGNERNICLLERTECKIVSHQQNKCDVPPRPFLTVLTGPDRGSEQITLDTNNLSDELISRMLAETQAMDWAKQFTILEAGRANSVEEWNDANELIKSVVKHSSFTTPNKRNAATDLNVEVQALTDLAKLLQELSIPEYNEEGVRTNPVDICFDEKSYVKLTSDIVDKVELLVDVACSVTKILGNQENILNFQTRPLEDLLEGLRLDFLATKASMGSKDNSKVDSPPNLWLAVENALETVSSLSSRLSLVSEVVEETRGNVDCLLIEMGNDKPTTQDGNNESSDEPLDFVKGLIGTTQNAVTPDKSSKSLKWADQDCDHNTPMCSRCMARMDEIDDNLVNCMTRLSNMEEVKNQNVESALLIKDQIFRGRTDIAAWLDKQFSADEGLSIEGGCFVTPHYILNLITADMCSINFPKVLIGDKELYRMNLKRADATSYYALLADKPDFMLTTKQCHGHTYLATKAESEKALFKFIPSYADFGRSSDSESLHHRFRRSLHHISEKQEKYIESRLAHKSEGQAFVIAKQLLDDCLKFVREMLDFMEELFSACNDSFNAPSEAWDLVCNCLEDLFTKEFKPSLKFCVAQDLVDVRESMIGVIHTAFSLNAKVRELTSIRLKNHSSTTTSHVRFVMKMAKGSNKGSDKVEKLKLEVDKLKEENDTLKKQLDDSKNVMKRLESRLDSHLSTYQKDKKLLAKASGGGRQDHQ